MNNRVEVLGVEFDAMTLEQLRSAVGEDVRRGDRFLLAFSNPEFLVEARHNEPLGRYLRSVRYNLADGVGVVWAARRLGTPLPERVTGTDWMYAMAELCRAEGHSLYLLGGRPGVAEEARIRLQEAFPGLKVVGTRDGYFEDSAAVVNAINAVRPTFLMVCLGNPRQERWITENAQRLEAQVVFGNGGALDFASGRVTRAPALMRKLSLEWLHRLMKDFTWARIKRQSRLALFVALVLRESGSKRRKGLSARTDSGN